MSTEKLDLTKPVQTRDGRPVRILCTDRKGTAFPVVGLVTFDDEAAVLEHLNVWPLDGRHEEAGFLRGDDLVNVPPLKQVTYFNMYSDGTRGGHSTRAAADRAAALHLTGRIACVKVEFSEGQFDE